MLAVGWDTVVPVSQGPVKGRDTSAHPPGPKGGPSAVSITVTVGGSWTLAASLSHPPIPGQLKNRVTQGSPPEPGIPTRQLVPSCLHSTAQQLAGCEGLEGAARPHAGAGVPVAVFARHLARFGWEPGFLRE